MGPSGSFWGRGVGGNRSQIQFKWVRKANERTKLRVNGPGYRRDEDGMCEEKVGDRRGRRVARSKIERRREWKMK